MPLAPEAKVVLDVIAAANRPPYPAIGAVAARREYKEARRFFQPSPPEVASVEDRVVPGQQGPIPIRHYRPLGAVSEAALPALVYFHGGGWTIGDLDTHDWVCRSIANAAGCAVVSVDYRLAPEHKFPAAVDDAFAATRWVVDEARALRIDPARVAVGGDSAGGNLATVVALLARDAGGPRLVAQALIYPGTSIAAEFPSVRALGEGYLLTHDLMAWFRACYTRGPEDHADWRASPLLAPDLSRLPPALVLTGEYDPLRDEGAAYADRLRAAGVETTYTCYPGMIHGFITMARAIPAASDAVRDVASALRRAFGSGAGAGGPAR